MERGSIPDEVREALNQLMLDAYQAGMVDIAAEVQSIEYRLGIFYRKVQTSEKSDRHER